MRSARGLIGLPVLDTRKGKRLGTVRDLLVDGEWRVRGIVLDYKSWLSSARIAEWGDVRAFGRDALMLDGKASIRKYKEQPGLSYLCYGKRRLKGLPVVTAEGCHMGHLEDVYFSQNMEDLIIGFELSEGLLTDLQEGRRRLPVPCGAERGEDYITIPPLTTGP